jgi:RNA polymerase sigma-70 factor (ECF subfamily)
MEASALTPAPQRAPDDAAAGACVISPFPVPEPKISLSRLFENEEARLLHFALGLVGRRSVAEDLVQEAFMRLHQVWVDVENPRAWLYRSLRNLALNHLRDHRRETALEGAPEPAHDGDIPPEEMGRREAVGVVRMLLAELPEADRQLIRLKYHETLKYQEIGQRTGLNAGNVGYRLHHLLKGLADSLRHAGVESSHG